MRVDAVVLAGGRARRMAGVDKLALTGADGVSVLDLVLGAAAAAGTLVVVGPVRPVSPSGAGREIVWVREEPAFGGPAAAVAAALPVLTADWVLVLAGDQPRAALGVGPLLAAVSTAPPGDGAVLVDPTGRRQWLAACYRTSALRSRLGASAVQGASLGSLLDGLDLIEVPDTAGASDDIDTPEDARRLLD